MRQQFIQQRLLPVEYNDIDDDPSEQKSEHERAEEKALIHYLQDIGKNPFDNFRRASVLIPLVRNMEDNHWNVILTRRAKHLKNHPGEICFPGGRFEILDITLQTTATRETQEEIGITPEQIQLIGRLPQQNTISQYRVTPYVGIIDQGYQLNIDKNEVDEAFLVPLAFTLNKNNHGKITKIIDKQSYSYYVIKYNNYRIWGATARMLVNLSHRLLN